MIDWVFCLLFDLCPGDVDWTHPEAPSKREFAWECCLGFLAHFRRDDEEKAVDTIPK